MTQRPDRPSLAAARRNLKAAARRKPTDDDRPPPSTFPGRRPKLIDGQINIEQAAGDGS